MRLNRAKQMRKHLRFYRIAYGIAPPYAVLLDGNFIHLALKVRMDILDRIKKLLLGEDFKCFVPRAVLDELRALGPATAASLQWAKACCEVLDHPAASPSEEQEEKGDGAVSSAGEAIRALIGARNEGKFMVATQDQELKANLRHVPSVALLFVARAVLLMEAPSDTSRAQSAVAEKGKVRRLDEGERALLAAVKGKGNGKAGVVQQQQQGGGGGGQQPTVRLKKKAKGPNPLSVKKGKKEGAAASKKDGGGGGAAAADERKRKRKHKKKQRGEGGGGGA